MSDNGDWERVTRTKPCMVCKSDHWCTRSRKTGHVCCMRIESQKPMKNGGYLHRNGNSNGRSVPRTTETKIAKVSDFAWLAESYRKAATNAKVVSLAKELGVSFDSLRTLDVGWDGDAWTFPMRSDTGCIVGIRRRFPDGSKKSVTGGHEGLFVPVDLDGESPLFICEGPTDTAALLGLGLPAVGRPSCRGGTAYLIAMCAGKRAVIMADSDTPGLRGARELKAKLSNATIIVPPAKDAREAVKNGWTRNDVLALAAYPAESPSGK